jgi:fatty-acyl-CoA synthase
VLPFADWLAAHATRTPAQVALIFEETEYTYGALAERSARLAQWLQHEQGLRPGARLAWLGLNTPDLIALLFACARVGVILVQLNWRLSDHELAAVVADAGVALAVIDSSCRERSTALPGITQVTVRFRCDGLAQLPADALGDAAVTSYADPQRGVLLVYTSGTTGRAKGALLSQDGLCHNARNAQHMHDMCAADRILTVLPMFHVGGLNIQTLPALACGATDILEARFDPQRTLASVASVRA